MHLTAGYPDSLYSIGNGNARMSICCRIYYNPVYSSVCALNLIDDCSLVVRLKALTLYPLVSAALGPRQLDFKLSFTYTKEEILTLFRLICAGRLDTSLYTLKTAPLSDVKAQLEGLASGEIQVARVLLMPNEG